MNKLRTAVSIAVLVAAVGAFTAPLTYAAPVKSITLSPASTALTVDPGITATRNLTLINDGDIPYLVDIAAAPYSVSGESYDPVFTRIPGTTDASAWVQIGQKTITLAAHQTATVPYTLTAPSVTAPGGYYAIIFAQTAGTDDSGVSAINRVGNILYITVNGTVTQGGYTKTADAPGFTFGNVVTLGQAVTNTGGVHFQTDAHFTVKGLTGATKLDETLSRYVLPQTTRLITQDFSGTGIGGIYKVSRSATIAGNVESLPDTWFVIVRPQIIPLVIFAILTIIGFVILLKRTRKHTH